MSDLLTRRGARELTATIDRVATAIQNNADLLGIPPKIALDYARRCDMISDAVELTAATNFPKSAEDDSEEGKKANEDGSLGATNGGWDPTQIADGQPPLEQDGDEPYMATFDEEEFHQLGDKVESGEIFSVDKFAADLDAWEKQAGVASSHVDSLSDLANRAKEMLARIEQAITPLLPKLNAEIKKPHEKIQVSYSKALKSIADELDKQRDELIRCQALGDCSMLLPTYDNMITIFTSAMDDIEEQLRVSLEGFEMEKRVLAKTASENKEAGLADLLARFQNMLMKNWRKCVQVAENAAALCRGASKDVDAAVKDFKALSKSASADDTKTASEDSMAGFALTSN